MNIHVEIWRKFYSQEGASSRHPVDGYLRFIERCSERNLPPIFEERHLASLIGVSYKKLVNLLLADSSRYRVFTIPKRLGGEREISVPHPLLLAIQQWILKHVLYKIPVSNHAHGGVPGRSIVSNASAHLGAAAVLRMDLKGFFDNIEMSSGTTVFVEAGYSPDLSKTLALLCFEGNKLPQGAATSSALSNLIARALDKRLAGLAEKFGLSYTRYIDDLTFSGAYIAVRFGEIVQEIIAESGFIVNPQKTILARGRSPKFVTGISVGGSKLRVPRAFRRSVKNEAFQLIKRGAERHAMETGVRDPLVVEVTLGRLAFWRQVEPESSTAESLFKQLDKYRRSSAAAFELPQPTRIVPVTFEL